MTGPAVNLPAPWIDPALLDRGETRWCHACGRRPDRSPIAGGCGCTHPATSRADCPECGGSRRADPSNGGCTCTPVWLAP